MKSQSFTVDLIESRLFWAAVGICFLTMIFFHPVHDFFHPPVPTVAPGPGQDRQVMIDFRNNSSAPVSGVPSVTPVPYYDPDVWNGPGLPGSGHAGVKIIHYRNGESQAIIDLSLYEATGGHVVFMNQTDIDNGPFMSAFINYTYKGKVYTWDNVQAYYSPLTGELVSSLIDDNFPWSQAGGVLDGVTGNKQWIDQGRLWS